LLHRVVEGLSRRRDAVLVEPRRVFVQEALGETTGFQGRALLVPNGAPPSKKVGLHRTPEERLDRRGRPARRSRKRQTARDDAANARPHSSISENSVAMALGLVRAAFGFVAIASSA